MSNEHKINGDTEHMAEQVYQRFVAYKNVYAPADVIHSVEKWIESGDSIFTVDFDHSLGQQFTIEGVNFFVHNDDFVILEK